MGFLIWPWDPWPTPGWQDGAAPCRSDAAKSGGEARVDKARESVSGGDDGSLLNEGVEIPPDEVDAPREGGAELGLAPFEGTDGE